MTVDPDIPRRVAQVRHDVDELYELVSGVDRKVDDLGTEVRDLHGDVRGLQGDVSGLQGEVRGLQTEVREGFAALNSKVDAQLGEILTALRGSRPAAGPDEN